MKGIAAWAWLLGAVLACAAPQRVAPEDDHWVRDIRLSTTRGEVGRPFRADITWRDNYLQDVEVAASGLPPGVELVPGERAIAGKPTRAGFFQVQIAVRKNVKRGRFHKPKPDERWWRETFEVEIYAPVE